MRPLLFSLGIVLTLPFAATEAAASSHSCNQLRQTIVNTVPGDIRNLPYAALPCAAISEIHLINTTYRARPNEQSRRIQAVFRRYGLIQ